MSWDGNGTFTRAHNFSADASAGIQAQAARFDAEFDEFKGGLENCLTKTGETTPTANQPMGGYRHTGVGNAASAANYASMTDVINQTGIYVIGVNSTEAGGNAILSLSAPIWSSSADPSEGTHFIAKTDIGANNASAPQIRINGGAAKTVFGPDGRSLSRSFWGTATFVEVVYDGSAGHYKAMSPPTSYDSIDVVGVAISSAAGEVGTGGDTVQILAARDGMHTFGKLNGTASISMSASAEHIRFYAAPWMYSSAGQLVGMCYVKNGSDFKPCQVWATGSDWRVRPVDQSVMSGTAVLVLPFTFSYLDLPD